MKKQRNATLVRITRTVTAFVLAAVLSLMGTGAAFAGFSETPYWQAPAAAATPDPDLITTYGVRDGGAGPDFLGISNTNFDFTQGPITSTLQYPVPSASNLNTTLVGSGLAIWATAVNEEPNPYYQNLYYNAVTTGSTATQATTWMSNPIASWGDSNASPSNKGNVSTGDFTIGGLEFDPDIIFGASKVTNWGNALSDGSNSSTIINDYFTHNPWLDYDPVFTTNDATNIWTQIYTIGQLATVADGLKSGTDKITRYDSNSATTSAISYEKAIRGNLLYVASQISTGEVQKKTVAYLYSIDSNGVGYFFTPQPNGMLVGDDTGQAPTTAANPDPSYAANNGTIGFGYRATLPFITETFDSGTTFPGGIIMGVEDIYKANPACTVSALAPIALANVDVLIYNTTTLRGSQLYGAQQGRNDSGIDIDVNYSADFVANWAGNHGFTGTYIAGDDFFASPNQGFMSVDTTPAGTSPLLYCQRNYTADKNAKAAWAFAQVYPELYNGNPDATYAYWVDKVYHVNLGSVPMVATFMLNKDNTSPVVYTQDTINFLEHCFAVGRYWWETSGYDDPDWSDFAYYSGSTRASYYSNNAASEEPTDTIGIFAPSSLWWADDSPPPQYAYSIGHNFGIDMPFFDDYEGDFTPNVDYAATVYAIIGYSSQYSYNPTDTYLTGKNPAGTDRLGSPVVFLNGHASYYNLLLGDAVDPPELRCGVHYGTDFTSSTTGYTYAGLQSRNLSGVKLISFVGCETAANSKNLCTRAVAGSNGADAALGFIDNIHSRNPEGQLWLQKYNDALAFGYTIFDAVEYAKSFAPDSDLADFAQIFGDSSTTITP